MKSQRPYPLAVDADHLGLDDLWHPERARLSGGQRVLGHSKASTTPGVDTDSLIDHAQR
jgi:hypothetical protein